MACEESNGHVTDYVTRPRKVKLETPIRLESNNIENSWRCYLATITDYCCEAVRSAVLATAWLLGFKG